MVSSGERERYGRQLSLPGFGEAGQARLGAARILVVGAGGLGSPILLYLAAAGVGTIGVIDDDVVDESNLHRQVLHREDSVGSRKTDSAATALAALNSQIHVRTHSERLTRANAAQIISGYDLVCDGSDNFATRYLVNDVCVTLGIPDVFGSIFQYEAQVGVFWAGHGPQYRDLYPAPPPPALAPSCADAGVLGALCGLTGSIMALEAVKLVAGLGDPLLGRILAIDAWTMEVRSLPVAAGTFDPASVPSGPMDDAELSPEALAELLSGGSVDLIDVREPSETASGVIPGARLVPLGSVLAGDLTMPADRAVVFYCAGGTRSAQALAVLEAPPRAEAPPSADGAGLPGPRHLTGGIVAWRRAGLDVALPVL